MPYDYRYIKSKIRYWQAQLNMLEQGSYEDSYRQYNRSNMYDNNPTYKRLVNRYGSNSKFRRGSY
jgi:hypothetical protein